MAREYDNIADAISAVNGEVAEQSTKIAGILEALEGKGGSLPSSISKIDGGSFTVASDASTVSYRISHNLGVEPKGVIIWTDDAVTNNSHLKSASLINVPYASKEGVRTTIRGEGSLLATPYTTADKANYISSTDFCINYNNILFARHVTYKWVAYA